MTKSLFKRIAAAAVAGNAVLTMGACSVLGVASAGTSSTGTGTGTATSVTSSAAISSAVSLSTVDTHYDANDLTWDASEVKQVTLADGASTTGASGVTVKGDVVTITQGGVYEVTGTLTDGQIVVSAPDDKSVTIILNGVEITNSAGPAIQITSADEVTLYTVKGTTSSVADGSNYTVANDATPVAAIASNSDLTVAGAGTLVVNGNTNDGINTSDGLAIVSGTLTVTAADDGIRGKDYVYVAGGTTTVHAQGDGVKSDNETDAGRGWVLVAQGSLTVWSGDDGIKGAKKVEIAQGTVTVAESVEGIESQVITISGGTVAVTASDDGINTTMGTVQGGTESDDGSVLTISGGTVTVKASKDGLDANGSARLTGGTITITSAANGGDGPIDTNGALTLGATITANQTQITSVDQVSTHGGGGGGRP